MNLLTKKLMYLKYIYSKKKCSEFHEKHYLICVTSKPFTSVNVFDLQHLHNFHFRADNDMQMVGSTGRED